MKTIALLLVIIINYCASGQVQTRFVYDGSAFKKGVKFWTGISSVIHKSMPKFNKRTVIERDSLDKLTGPHAILFGKAMDVNIDVLNEGEIYRDKDSSYLFYQIHSKGASSINLLFGKLVLSEKSSLIIYDANLTCLYGPIRKNQIPQNSSFFTDKINGEKIIIQVSTLGDFFPGNQQRGGIVRDDNIRISKVVHGIEKIGIYVGGGSLPCEVDTKCIEGANWHDVDQSVAMLLYIDFTGQWARFCTGSLINNALQDYTPNFLTAFHCLDTDKSETLSASETSAVNSWAFRFFYTATGCNINLESPYYTFNGSSFRAAYQPSDFALLLLSQQPNGITYAGWNRSSTTPSAGVSIHHPKGDMKKIATNSSVVNLASDFSFPTGTPALANYYWKSNWSSGLVESGSSGAPLFNSAHQIVGQLRGGPDEACGNISFDLYGKISISFNGGGTPTTRLSDWLDPYGWNQQSVASSCAIYDPSPICSTASFGANIFGVNWSSGNPTGLTIDANGNATRINNFNGAVSVSVSLSVGCSTSKVVYVGVPTQPGNISGDTQPAIGNISQYVSHGASQGAIGYQWSTPWDWSLWGGNSNWLVQNILVGSASGNVQVAGYNNCGQSAYSRIRVFPVQGSCTTCPRLSNSMEPNTDESDTTYFKLAVFPIPASNEITVRLPKRTLLEESLVIEDLYGNVKRMFLVHSGEQLITLSTDYIEPGFYIIKVMNRGKQYARKIVIQR